MPIITRKQLRRDLGTLRLRECTLGTSQLIVAVGSAVTVFDPVLANTDYSGQNLFQRANIRAGSADYRVGSYNFASGAFVSGQAARFTMPSGGDFEIHDRWTATELDNCINQTLTQIRVEREVAFPTIDGATFYALDAAASPNSIVDWGEVYYFAQPTSTTNRMRGDFAQCNVVPTATGLELRIDRALGASQQIVIDAFLQLTLGADDAATINIPNEDWLLWGAAARAYDLLMQRTPGQDATILSQRREEAARAFTKISQRLQPGMERKLSFQTPDNGGAQRRTISGYGVDPF